MAAMMPLGRPCRSAADAESQVPSLGPDRVIIEFLGVSSSGKSTLAQALAARCDQQGYRTRLLTMQRPTALGRVLGVLHKFANMCRIVFGHRDEFAIARYLMGLFPQENLLNHVRVMLYILYLFSLRSKVSGCQIAIFDQGFAQAIYSLALFSQRRGADEFADAFGSIPKPDLVVSLGLPPEVVAQRLGERRGLAGVARVTATDSEAMRRSFRLITRIEGVLKESGCRVIHYCPGNAVSIERSTDDLYRTLRCVVGEPRSARAWRPSLGAARDAPEVAKSACLFITEKW